MKFWECEGEFSNNGFYTMIWFYCNFCFRRLKQESLFNGRCVIIYFDVIIIGTHSFNGRNCQF